MELDSLPRRALLSRVGAALLSLFYPAHCAACGCRLPGEGSKEGVICDECRKSILPPPAHCCPTCSHPMAGIFLCPNCDGRRWHLSVIVAACRYEGIVRELIQRFKYGRDQSLICLLGDLLDQTHGKSGGGLCLETTHSKRCHDSPGG
ncbi:MAG: double zinc ribbon domain-containing protein [Verrucomicrobia bacterium]|nr:double zinc ribbon domain-containing protein [Verrucomicrobiota bacterium]